MLKCQKYGKANVRVVKTTLKQNLVELTVAVLLSGSSFECSYSHGDNSLVVPTDTVKNTVYVLAKKSPKTLHNIEVFAMDLVAHFLTKYDHVEGVDVSIESHDWSRIQTSTLSPTTESFSGSDLDSTKKFQHPHSFYRGGDQKRTVSVVGTRSGSDVKLNIVSGLKDLYVLKTTGSSFENYHLDELTTLPPMSDRILSTMVSCNWSFPTVSTSLRLLSKAFDLTDSQLKGHQVYLIPYNAIYSTVKQTTLDIFANHDSPSVQNTLFRMGVQILGIVPEIKDVSYELPNKHVFTYDLGRFGVKNETGMDSTVYYPVNDPSGLITATICRPNPKL